MSHIKITDINYLIKGEIENLINLNIELPTGEKIKNKTFLTDTGLEESSISSTSMTHRIIKTTNNNNTYISKLGPNNIIYALFDFKDVAAKSKVFKKNNITSDIKTGDGEIPDDAFIDIYAPHLSSDPIDFCNGIYVGSDGIADLISFGLSKSTTKSPLIKGTNLFDTYEDRINNKNNSLYWNYKVIESGNKTYLAVPLSNLEKQHYPDDPLSLYYPVSSYYDYMISYGNLSTEKLFDLFDPIYNLKDIERNYIYQLNLMDNRQICNNHNTGNIMCDFVIGKNPYNAQYSMNMDSIDALSNARQYIGLGSVGGKIFFKYNDNINYVKDNTSTLPHSRLTNIEFKKHENVNDDTNNYQKIEYLNSVSQFKASSAHKTNLYSIKVKGLFDNILPNSDIEKNLEIIKSDITRSIRKIAENLSPAHTQLFDVIYYDKANNLINENDIGILGNAIFKYYNEDHTIICGLTEYGMTIENLLISSDVISILNGALNQSNHAVKIEVNNNENFDLVGSLVSSNYGTSSALVYNGNTLVSYPVDAPGYLYVIPESISNVYSSAFYNCKNLYKVEIPLSACIDGQHYYNDLSDANSKPTALAISKSDTPIIVEPYYSYDVIFNSGKADDLFTYEQHFRSNEDQQLCANLFTKDGYLFKNWIDSYSNTYEDRAWNYYKQFSNTYNDAQLTANWTPIKYYIDFCNELYEPGYEISANGNMENQQFTYDDETEQIDKCTLVYTGYHFKGWNLYNNDGIIRSELNDEAYISNLTTVDNAIISACPIFDPNTYYIKLINTSSNIIVKLPNEISAKYDNPVFLSDVNAPLYGNISAYDDGDRHDYVVDFLIGYYENGQTIYQQLPTTPESAVDYVYKPFENLTTVNEASVYLSTNWSGIYYINFDKGTPTDVTGNMDKQQALIKDIEFVLNENKYDAVGYEFNKWKYGNNTYYYNNQRIYKPLSNEPGSIVTLTATWTRIYYIYFDKNGGEGEQMKPLNIKEGKTYALTPNTYFRKGYEFKGWSYEPRDNKNPNVTSADVDFYYNSLAEDISFTLDRTIIDSYIEKDNKDNNKLTLYAVWEPNTYYVKFNENL